MRQDSVPFESCAYPRRAFLRLGIAGGLGVTLSDSAAPVGASSLIARARSIILVYAGGGISHLESFDPHPRAPAQTRGEFSAIQTTSPGVLFSEHVPRLAASLSQFSVIRSMRHAERDHGVSAYY